ncbi:MAG: YhdP family protein [Pseudomonadota bacterium]
MPKAADLLRFVQRRVMPVLGLLVILAAMLLSAARLALPWFAEDVRAWVEQQAFVHGVELSVEQFSLDWSGLGPRLGLRDAILFGEAGAQPLSLQRLALTLDIPRSLLGASLRFSSLEIEGVRIQVLRDRDGRWQLRGLGIDTASGQSEGWPAWMDIAHRVDLVGSQLELHDEASNTDLLLQDIEALFEQNANDRRLALRIDLPEHLGGRLEVRARLPNARIDPAHLDGELWLQTSGLHLAGWSRLLASLPLGELERPVLKADLPRFETGKVSGELWLRLTQGQLADARAKLDLADWRLSTIQAMLAGEREVALESRLDIQLGHHDDAWTLDIEARPNGQSEAPQRFSLLRHGEQISMAAERVNLDLLRPWLVATPILPSPLRQTLILRRPTGKLNDLRMRIELASEDADVPRVWGHAGFDTIGWSGQSYLPGVAGLGGELWLDGASAQLRLDSPGLVADFHDKFREPMVFSQVRGNIALFWGGTPMLDLRDLHLSNRDLELDLGLRLDLPASGETLASAEGRFRRIRVERIPAYLPVAELGEEALAWLDKALPKSGGKVPEGRLSLHGDLNHFPYYDDGSGQFEVRFPFQDLKLDFAPGWRHAEQLHGELAFVNNGLTGRIDGGSILDVPLREGWLSMPDFDHPRLDLRLALDGKVESMLEVLKSSPLIPDRSDLDQVRLTGPAALRVQAEVRLESADPRPSLAEGWLDLHGARLSGFEQQFERIQGQLHFVDDALDAQGVRARYHEEDARLAVSTDLSGRKPAYRIDMDTVSDATTWLPEGSRWNRYIHGRTPIRASLFLGAAHRTGREVSLTLSTDLKGLTIDLPAPHGKSAEERRPTEATLGWQKARLDTLLVRQPERVEARLRMDGLRVRSGHVQLGAGDARWPAQDARTLRLEGRQPSFDLAAWQAVFEGDDQGGEDTLPDTLDIRVQIDSLSALGGDWEGMSVEGRRDLTGWKLDLLAPRLAGTVRIPRLPTPAEPLSLDLSWVVLREDDETETGKDETPPTDPTTLPPLRIAIADLHYGDIHLRDAFLRALPQPRGLLLQELRASTPHLAMRGEGSWMLGDKGGQLTRINLNLVSGDVGAALGELGFRKALRRGRLENTRLALRWPDAPDRFDWGILEGEGSLDIRQGSIENVEPGAGRVLGLLSIAELPRRLTLDFGDVFGEGLRFDRIRSDLRFHDGLLETDPMELSGPSAQIIMRGHSNMRSKTLHYDMVVVPALGNVLPIIGTVAGGPLIGGAVFLMQRVFDQFEGEHTGFNYRVTGSWDDPKVEKMENLERPAP